jgi:uncharacterized membrane protein SpoIIM required for sporulation
MIWIGLPHLLVLFFAALMVGMIVRSRGNG